MNMGLAATRARLTRLAHLLSVVSSAAASLALHLNIENAAARVRSLQASAAAAPTINVPHGHRDAP